MRRTRQHPPPERNVLADARARLFSAALRAQQNHTLAPDLAVRVRLALKAGRSKRCSDSGRQCAARHYLRLAQELERSAQ